MKYLLHFAHGRRSPFADAEHEHMRNALMKLNKGFKDGSIDCCYTKVGGGGFVVVNSSNHESLTRMLRLYGITDAEVTPVVDTRDVMEGYIEHHQIGHEAFTAKYNKKC